MMFASIINMIPWVGYAFLGFLFLVLLRNLQIESVPWNDLFTNRRGRPNHLSRYLLLFGSLAFALKFLIAVLAADDPGEIQAAIQLFGNINIEAFTGVSGTAYLLSKITGGRILTMFGKDTP
ncbi:MAG: hypothetical protein PVG70_17990 [Desulfobacterales bacterium]